MNKLKLYILFIHKRKLNKEDCTKTLFVLCRKTCLIGPSLLLPSAYVISWRAIWHEAYKIYVGRTNSLLKQNKGPVCQ